MNRLDGFMFHRFQNWIIPDPQTLSPFLSEKNVHAGMHVFSLENSENGRTLKTPNVYKLHEMCMEHTIWFMPNAENGTS